MRSDTGGDVQGGDPGRTEELKTQGDTEGQDRGEGGSADWGGAGGSEVNDRTGGKEVPSGSRGVEVML